MRLFIAIELNAGFKQELRRLQQLLDRRDSSALRLVDEAQMHLTLKFIGDVDDQLTADLTYALECAAAESAPFEIYLQKCGCFPPRGPARVIWAGVADRDSRLKRLWQKIEEQCELAGVTRETRGFSPHLTLARAKDGAPPSLRQQTEDLAPQEIVQRVSEFALIQSVLERAGARHTVLKHFRLPGG